MIALDTNAAIAIVNRRPTRVRDKLLEALAASEPVGLPAVVLAELSFGVWHSAQIEMNRNNLRRFLALKIEFWPLDAADAEAAGRLRADLFARGTPIGPYDILIAAQARRRDATLVTANGREFDRVAGLKVEDWART